jgi:hypothetical protein
MYSKFCVECGVELNINQKFCGKCGSARDSNKSQISPKESDYDLYRRVMDARPKRKRGLLISGILILSLGLPALSILFLTTNMGIGTLIKFIGVPSHLVSSIISLASLVILALSGGILIVKGAIRKEPKS